MNAIPGYRTEAVLGRGRSAVVYLAVHGHSARKVALKVARRNLLERQGQSPDFGHEFAALLALAPCQVIRAHDHGLHGDDAYLSMDLMAGSVAQRIPGVPGPARTHALMSQVALALGQVHARGWVHRDVKPSNLLLHRDGRLMLGDLGCACRLGERGPQPAGTVIGTPRYAAPEQNDGAGAQPSADVYSLGVLLHELLTGQAPYPGETLTELFSQHQMAPVPRLPVALTGWQPLLDALLAKSPGDRPTDGHAVLEELTRLRKGLS